MDGPTRSLVYVSVFSNDGRIERLQLLLESMIGRLSPHVTVLIQTHHTLEADVRLVADRARIPIRVWLMDGVGCLFSSASRTRLRIFDWPDITGYDKLLHLDVDSLINSRLDVLFSFPLRTDKLYVVQEGGYVYPHNGSELPSHEQQPHLTSGVLLFANSQENRESFQQGLEHNPIPEEMCDRQLLGRFVENSPVRPSERIVVYRFPVNTSHSNKLKEMLTFRQMQWTDEFEECGALSGISHDLRDLENVVRASGGLLEGNAFYAHLTLHRDPALLSKQINLFQAGKRITKRVCEIGFNAGHSALLLLLGQQTRESDTDITFTIFDIGLHPYMHGCLEKIKTRFQGVEFEFVEGDSTVELPRWLSSRPEMLGQYDVVHVDGGHSADCIASDMSCALRLVASGGIIIVDDTWCPNISGHVDTALRTGMYRELDMIPVHKYAHRMIQKVVCG